MREIMITLGAKIKLLVSVGDPPMGVFCPCGCGRELPIPNTPFTHDIKEFGNIIWQQLVLDKGVEGAIVSLHEAVDIG